MEKKFEEKIRLKLLKIIKKLFTHFFKKIIVHFIVNCCESKTQSGLRIYFLEKKLISHKKSQFLAKTQQFLMDF